MSDGHFWHDMIEGVVIWESDEPTPAGETHAPIEAESLHVDVQHASPSESADVHLIDAAPEDTPGHFDDTASA